MVCGHFVTSVVFTGSDITSVDVEAVPCSKVSMDLFDPLYSGGVLRPSGQIVKCYHEIYGDFDELRNVCWLSVFYRDNSIDVGLLL